MANATPNSMNEAHNQTEATISKIPHILPHERVFPIQIGTELFKLSGASISSDGMAVPAGSKHSDGVYRHCQGS